MLEKFASFKNEAKFFLSLFNGWLKITQRRVEMKTEEFGEFLFSFEDEFGFNPNTGSGGSGGAGGCGGSGGCGGGEGCSGGSGGCGGSGGAAVTEQSSLSE